MKRRQKLKKGVIAGGVLLASSILSGCVRSPQSVYGPPSDYADDDPPFRVEENLPAPVYGPAPDFDGDYDAQENIPVDLYGPPAWENGDLPAEGEAEAQP